MKIFFKYAHIFLFYCFFSEICFAFDAPQVSFAQDPTSVLLIELPEGVQIYGPEKNEMGYPITITGKSVVPIWPLTREGVYEGKVEIPLQVNHAQNIQLDFLMCGEGGCEPVHRQIWVEPSVNAHHWGIYLFWAFVGGVILNLMPCVLPILPIKLLSMLSHPGTAKRHFVAHGLGILSCFILLGVMMATLRWAGMSLGWGAFFQHPLFLILISLCLIYFAAQLLGWVKPFTPSFMPAQTGSFMTGFLMTLIATPCAAPFVGSVIGFAFTQQLSIILALFSVMGLGFGLPYWSMVLYPGFIRFLPKPGNWMRHFQRASACAIIFIAVWIVHPVFKSTPLLQSGLWEKVTWVDYTPHIIEAHLANQKTVFVVATAQWCVTCKVNEQVMSRSSEIQKILNRPDVVVVKADWSNHDPEIFAYLQSHQRLAVPYYRIYTPHVPKGYALSEIITPSNFLTGFKEAGYVQ